MITLDDLKLQVAYDPLTGLFTRLKSNNSRYRVGDICGSLDSKGYVIIRLLGKDYKAHRLAWYYITGEFPQMGIDHRDRVKSNNVFTNLRLATKQENARNQGLRKSNTTGHKGVSYTKASGLYLASICDNYKSIHLGFHPTVEDASAAYTAAAARIFKEFAPIAA